jgi:two-component system nitrate/nitrite response regulator NarL
MKRPFATVLAAQSPLLREGLARILGTAGFRIVASVASVHDLAPGTLPQRQSILLIIDSADSLIATAEQIQLFKEQHPASRVAVFADHYRLADIMTAFEKGANACFARIVTHAAFIKGLELVMLGETILPTELLSMFHGTAGENANPVIINQPEIEFREQTQVAGKYVRRLSPRETRILRCIVEGATNRAIARTMNIAETTVKVHLRAIFRKLRVDNRTQAPFGP